MRIVERLFKLKEHGTDVRTELLVGVTTFLTMAYISAKELPVIAWIIAAIFVFRYVYLGAE